MVQDKLPYTHAPSPHPLPPPPSSAHTCMLLTTISGPRPVAYASDAATRDARREPGSVMRGQPAHRASQAPVNVLKGMAMQVATVERDQREAGPKEHCTRLKVWI